MHVWTKTSLLLVACGGAELSEDQQAYLSLIEQKEMDLEPGLEECAALQSPTLRSDCQLHMLLIDAARGGGGIAPTCLDLDSDLVQQECWFLAAEAARSHGQDQLASQYCRRSGSFVNDCGQHLWQTALRRIVHRQGPPDFPGSIDSAEKLFSRWAPLLGESTDINTRFWPRFYANGFEGGGGVVLSWCSGLEATHLELCEEAGAEVYGRDMAPRLEDNGIDLCSLSTPDSTSLEQWVPAQPHPRLDRVIADRVAEVCTD
jgi:hypothetical protein